MPFSTANGLNSTVSARTMPLKKQCTHEGSSLEILKGGGRGGGSGRWRGLSQVKSHIYSAALMRLLRSDVRGRFLNIHARSSESATRNHGAKHSIRGLGYPRFTLAGSTVSRPMKKKKKKSLKWRFLSVSRWVQKYARCLTAEACCPCAKFEMCGYVHPNEGVATRWLAPRCKETLNFDGWFCDLDTTKDSTNWQHIRLCTMWFLAPF